MLSVSHSQVFSWATSSEEPGPGQEELEAGIWGSPSVVETRTQVGLHPGTDQPTLAPGWSV
jgi:hypothetical protein